MHWTGFRIWILSILLNGLFLGVWAAFAEAPILLLIVAFAATLIGIFFTAPLLLIVMPLVDIAGKLPYSVNARIFWLFIMLAVIGVMFPFLLQMLRTSEFWKYEKDLIKGLMISISLAIGLAVYSERNSLKRRYEEGSKPLS